MRRQTDRIHWGAGLGLAAALALIPGRAHAQEARLDSLEARVGRLEILVDSLIAELRRLSPEGAGEAPPAADAEPGQAVEREPARAEAEPAAVPAAEAEPAEADELAALRAAARAAAAEGGPVTAADTALQVSRTRNLNVLNPEISVTGDVLGAYVSPGGEEGRFGAIPREFEFSFQAALDPYTRTKIFVNYEEELEIAGLEQVLGSGSPDEESGRDTGEGGGSFGIEEAYAYWVGLPGAVGLKAGKLRQEIGLYNRWHTHALFEVDRPLPTVAFLGEDGLIQTGASLTLPSFTVGPATQTAWFEAASASNALFEGGTGFSYLGRVQSFLDLSPATYLQLGANALFGRNDDIALDSRLFSVDASFRWAPPGRSLYRQLALKGEWYWATKDFGEFEQTGRGGYAQANFRFDRRWIAGLRADYLDNFGAERSAFQLVPSVSWWQSEWLRLRLQYNYLKPEGLGAGHSLLFQTVWAVGPHKHETY